MRFSGSRLDQGERTWHLGGLAVCRQRERHLDRAPGGRGWGGRSFASVLSASGPSDSRGGPKAEENGPAGSPDASVQVQTDGLMGRGGGRPGVGGAGKRAGEGLRLPDVMCPALKWDFPKQGSPIRASIRVQMKVPANQSHLLLLCTRWGSLLSWEAGSGWVQETPNLPSPRRHPLTSCPSRRGKSLAPNSPFAPPHRGARHPHLWVPCQTLRGHGWP